MTNRKSRQTHTTPSRRFIDKARELGCEEDEAAFDAKLKLVARQKSKPEIHEAPNK